MSTITYNQFIQLLEKSLPDVQIFEDEYDKPFTIDDFWVIVQNVHDKLGLKGRAYNNLIKWRLDNYYWSYMARVNKILLTVDEKISEIIDEAVEHSGRFKDAKADPITTLQLYRVIRGKKVNDNLYITQNIYQTKKQYQYMGNQTHREWYTIYLERRNRKREEKELEPYKIKPSDKEEIKQIEYINFGYKGKDKVKSLYKHYGKEYVEPEEQESNYFPLKRNIKSYQLHKVRGRNSYLIDLMKTGKIYYLLSINVNTKYLFAEPTNVEVEEDKDEEGIVKVSNSVKNAKICADTMLRLLNRGQRNPSGSFIPFNPQYIESDGEGGFSSDYVKRVVYERYNIEHDTVPRQRKTQYPKFMIDESNKWNKKTEPLHGSLGIIDRVTRTIRDIAYNMKVGVILPNVMEKIVEYYNNAPHKGLSKWAGFSVTPQMVMNDKRLEEYIVRKIVQANHEIMNRLGFQLKEGTEVKVYNEKDSLTKRRSVIQPGKFIVQGFNRGLYRVKNINDGSIQLVPRFKLNPL